MNYIEHWDQELDLTFEIPELDMDGYFDLEEFLADHSEELHAALLSALYNAHELQIDRVPAFAVKGSDAVVCIERPEFAEKLDSCIRYYSQKEEYEICKLLTTIKSEL